MPVRKTKQGWTFGGQTYDSKAKAERAYRGYLASKNGGGKRKSKRRK